MENGAIRKNRVRIAVLINILVIVIIGSLNKKIVSVEDEYVIECDAIDVRFKVYKRIIHEICVRGHVGRG
jgi:uncharacterized protein (UPF0548 family)